MPLNLRFITIYATQFKTLQYTQDQICLLQQNSTLLYQVKPFINNHACNLGRRKKDAVLNRKIFNRLLNNVKLKLLCHTT